MMIKSFSSAIPARYVPKPLRYGMHHPPDSAQAVVNAFAMGLPMGVGMGIGMQLWQRLGQFYHSSKMVLSKRCSAKNHI
jgi:hypothetical protein